MFTNIGEASNSFSITGFSFTNFCIPLSKSLISFEVNVITSSSFTELLTTVSTSGLSILPKLSYIFFMSYVEDVYQMYENKFMSANTFNDDFLNPKHYKGDKIVANF